MGPGATIADDVTLTPFSPVGLLNIFRFGAVTGTGRAVDLGPMLMSSRAHRAVAMRTRPRPDLTALAPAVWVGSVYTHFGHFITETLPRLIAARASLQADPSLRLVGFALPGGFGPLPPHVTWFADRLGLDLSRLDVVTGPTRVARLILPASPFDARFRYAPGLTALIDTLGLGPPRPSGERVFLSRAELGAKSSRVTNIAEVEGLYRQAGFTILYPETLGLADQIHHITSAAVLAGENGSALHWSLYSPHIRAVHALGWSLALQRGICAARGQSYVPLRTPWLGALRGRTQHVDVALIQRTLS